MSRYSIGSRSRDGTLRRLLLTGAVAGLAAAVLAAPAHALPVPDEDPFYAAPTDLAAQPNGSVLAWREIAPFGLPLPVHTWQVQYRSTGSDEQPVAAMATVLMSPLPWWGPGPRPLLTYQVAEDSLGTRCAPSFALAGGQDPSALTTVLDAPFLTDALRRGWAVVVPDYQGPQSRFLDGVTAGRLVLDGVRAARALPPAALPDSPVAAWGYSGGAFAALWAAQLHGEYAPELPFVGASAGGVPTDMATVARAADGGGRAGLTLVTVFALTRIDPALGELLNERGQAAMAETADACGTDLMGRFANARIADYAAVPDLLSDPRFVAAMQRQELGAQVPDLPLYLYHSVSDEVVPIDAYTALVDRWCAGGATLTARYSPVPGHTGAAIVEALGGMNYLADRFAGGVPGPGCSVLR